MAFYNYDNRYQRCRNVLALLRGFWKERFGSGPGCRYFP